MTIITHDVNGLAIGQRQADGYIDLTAMAKANKKKINDYIRLKSTKEFLKELEAVTGIPVTELVQVFQGGDGEQGTWGHPQVATHCGQWCSPKFAVVVSQWIMEWMTTGKNPVQQPTAQPQPLLAPPEPPLVMPTPEQVEFMRQPGAMSDPDWMSKGNWDKAFQANREYQQALERWQNQAKRLN